jgi:hypothetical protein
MKELFVALFAPGWPKKVVWYHDTQWGEEKSDFCRMLQAFNPIQFLHIELERAYTDPYEAFSTAKNENKHWNGYCLLVDLKYTNRDVPHHELLSQYVDSTRVVVMANYTPPYGKDEKRLLPRFLRKDGTVVDQELTTYGFEPDFLNEALISATRWSLWDDDPASVPSVWKAFQEEESRPYLAIERPPTPPPQQRPVDNREEKHVEMLNELNAKYELVIPSNQCRFDCFFETTSKGGHRWYHKHTILLTDTGYRSDLKLQTLNPNAHQRSIQHAKKYQLQGTKRVRWISTDECVVDQVIG